MRTLAYTVHDARGGRRPLTSATAAVVLWVALIASNLWWLYQAGALQWPLLGELLGRPAAPPTPSLAAARPPVAQGIQVAQQRNLKLDADGAF